MTGNQLRKALKRSGRTILGAAREMEIDPTTLHRYLADKLPVPKLVELVASCWLDHSKNKGEQA